MSRVVLRKFPRLNTLYDHVHVVMQSENAYCEGICTLGVEVRSI